MTDKSKEIYTTFNIFCSMPTLAKDIGNDDINHM